MRSRAASYRSAIATNRFGLGARPQDPPAVAPQSWVLGGISAYRPRPPVIETLEPSDGLARRFFEAQHLFRQQRQSMATGAAGPNPASELADQAYAAQLHARIALAVEGPAPFVERLVHFWANHFAVSADRPVLRALAGAMEHEAIRPHVLGRFTDLLLAVERHAAMLIYLDQARSIGPNSTMARETRRRRPGRAIGLNENLARELLELHTLGGGHSQADVQELARALTGWTLGGPRPFSEAAPVRGRFAFRPEAHEPGGRTCLGKRYSEGGEEQALAMLHDLASHPATARHIATKLARHLVADDPPPALVERLARVFLRTDGDLSAVYQTVIEAPEAWTAPLAKFKSPWEWMISALRGLRVAPDSFNVRRGLSDLGQPVWRPRSPAGWPDKAQSWAGPHGLFARVRLAEQLGQVARPADARAIAPLILPGVLRRSTATIISEAASAGQGLALLAAAPEFLRR
jgi:uncharacterized protein (DUF1800 family)